MAHAEARKRAGEPQDPAPERSEIEELARRLEEMDARWRKTRPGRTSRVCGGRCVLA